MSVRPPRGTVGVRAYVDHALARRAVLRSLATGTTTTAEVCDAHPHLLLAARHHGEASPEPCPVCRRRRLALLRYVFSEELGQFSGRLKSPQEIADLSEEHGEVRVHVVEVCRCGWNHLRASYVVGDGTPRRPPRRQRTVEDDWGS